MLLKIDLTKEHKLSEILALRPHFLGIHFSNENKISLEQLDTLPTTVQKVGIFVNEELENIISAIYGYNLDAVELHGSNNLNLCKKIKKETDVLIIKAISILDSSNFWVTKQYEKSVDLFLFETKVDIYKKEKKSFHWQILEEYKGEKEFILKGKITKEDSKKIAKLELKKMIGIQNIQ